MKNNPDLRQPQRFSAKSEGIRERAAETIFFLVQGRDKGNLQVCVDILWETLQFIRIVQKREAVKEGE